MTIKSINSNSVRHFIKWSMVTALVVSIVLGISSIALGRAHGGESDPSNTLRAPSAPSVQMALPELPREWVWSKKAQSFSGMHRKTR